MRAMNQIAVSLGLLVLFPPPGNADVDTLWTRTYPYTTTGAGIWGGGPSVQQTLDGGFIVATEDGSGSGNVQVVKTDDLGEVLWTKSYGLGPDLTRGISIRQLRDGDYVMCGGRSGPFGSYSGWLMRLDAEGEGLWAKLVGGVNKCIQQTLDDGFIIAGYHWVDTNGTWPILVKTDGDGNVEWEEWWSHEYGASFNHVVELRDGSGYALVGQDPYGVYFVRTNLTGVQVASRSYEGNWGSEICETSDDGFIMCGQSDDEAHLIRTDAAGDKLWTKKYAPLGSWAMALSVIETSRGDCLSVGQGSDQVWILETDATGDSLWSKSYDIFSDAEYARRIRSTSDGGYIIAGGGMSHPDQPYSLFLMRLEESATDVSPPVAETPSTVYLQPNVPNPFNQTTTIRYCVPEPGEVLLRIYDPMGRQIRTLVHASRSTGTHTIRWDGTNQAGAPVADGVYFCQLNVDGEMQARCMILAR
jgi:hypothetical protein